MSKILAMIKKVKSCTNSASSRTWDLARVLGWRAVVSRSVVCLRLGVGLEGSPNKQDNDNK